MAVPRASFPSSQPLISLGDSSFSAPLLRFAGVTKRFDRTLALDALDFEAHAGEVILVTGPNGAGKTTLLRIAATLERATRGDVEVDGRASKADGPTVRARIGFVGHEPGVYTELTVQENIEFFAGFHMPRRDARRAAEDAVAQVGLASRADERARTLSRGLKQRVALARALVHAPDIILLDEPETALDAAGRVTLRAIIRKSREDGRLVIVATHDPERLHEVGTRCVALERGRIVSDTRLGGGGS